MNGDLTTRLDKTAFAFRGYNVTNLGRTSELLAHRRYGPIVAEYLKQASRLCRRVSGKRVDLTTRVRKRIESTMATFDQAVAIVVAVELAQLKILEEVHSISYHNVAASFGYSVGEITALIAGGVYDFEDIVLPQLELIREAAELAHNVTMGVLFSRAEELDLDRVSRLCLQISNEGRGVIAISSHLAPNAVLLLSQGETIDRFKTRMTEAIEDRVHLRKNPHHWPPLHTPILWERAIPDRAGCRMVTVPGGFRAPTPPVYSLVTGDRPYNDYNSRELLRRWVDHPQRLWDVVYATLASGIERVVHVGPEPNLIPATFKRLSDNVASQFTGQLSGLGLRAVKGLISRPWLARLLSARTALLRAPFIEHVILEDWLLDQPAK